MLAQQGTRGLGMLETKELLAALRAFRKGDLAARLPADWQGLAGKVADAFNDLADRGDREKCLSAGASDYIAKPVDPDQLLSLLHGCLCR